MNQDDIIRIARDAGFPFNKYGLLQGDDDGEIDITDMLVRFAELVAAAEREACAGICDRFAERHMHPAECAAAIRARGNT